MKTLSKSKKFWTMKQFLVFMVILTSVSVGMGFSKIMISDEGDGAPPKPSETSKSFTP